MATDLQRLLLLGAVVLAASLLSETAARRGRLPQWLSRKLLHIVAVGACSLAAWWIADLRLLISTVAIAEILLIYLVARGVLFVEANGRRSWGIAIFPIAYLLLLIAFPQQRLLIALSMGILALADAAAAIAGRLCARRYYQLTGDRKSVVGNLAFTLVTVVVLLVAKPLLGVTGPAYVFVNYVIWIAVLLALLEALGSNGFDNALIPLGAALLLYDLPGRLDVSLSLLANANLLLGLLFAGWTVRRGSLTWDGAVLAVVLGWWVVIFVGPVWLFPLFFFFLSGSLFSRFHRARRSGSDAKHGRARDWVQVICNGGPYLALATWAGLTADPRAYVLMAVSLAVATADTWSSELGIYFRGPTYDILSRRRLPVGVSGGVSGPGTLAGLAGALAMSLLCKWLAPDVFSWPLLLLVAVAGFAGMLVDSLLGATLQIRYKDTTTGLPSDTATAHSYRYSGWWWMTNDGVNLVSNVFVVGVLGILGWLV